MVGSDWTGEGNGVEGMGRGGAGCFCPDYAPVPRRGLPPFFYCDDKALLSKELTWIHHGGVSDGAQSWLVVYPEYQLVLAMNTNTVKENYCDFAGQAAAIVRPFMRQIAPELFVNEKYRFHLWS